MEDEKYMKLALAEAQTALKEGNWPIGCVIVADGKVVASAHNQRYSKNDTLAHAEMLAIKSAQEKVGGELNDATLYTTYEPCPMCFGAIILSRIKHVVCGIDLDQSGAMYFKEHLPRLFKQDAFSVDLKRGVLADECYEVFIQGEPTKKLIDSGMIRSDLDTSSPK